MLELVEANWLAFLAVLFLGLAVAWWIWGRAPAERVRADTPDVLTPGAAPAQRNDLLVEAPPAAAVTPPAATIGMAGIGEVIAAAAAQEINDAEAAAESATAPDYPANRPAIAPAQGEPDDLTKIKGVGPKLNALLKELGVTRYDQIAGWSEGEIAMVDPYLGAFQGRIVRDNWVEQCRYLAAEDVAGFEARFGKV
jgi:predicted flap endonuclease-1-like 5' DNA nuclease